MFSPLDIFLGFFGIFLIFLSIFRLHKRLSFFLRFLVFFAGSSLIVFVIFPHFLGHIGKFFGLSRGADLLVYLSVSFLFYSVLVLHRKNAILAEKITKSVREMTIFSASRPDFSAENIFVIPAYNEGKILEKTLTSIQNFPKSAILVINDGSSDETFSILQKISQKYHNIFFLSHSQNLGQGAALETGFEYIRRHFGEVKNIITFDADGQHDIADLPKMLEYLEKNPHCEVILGSRFLGKSPKNIPFFRKMILKGGIFFTKIISGISLTDTHNGFRVFRRNAINKVKITIDGMGHASEILDIISREKIIFHEMPTNIHYTEYSLHKGQSSSNSLHIAAKMLFKKFF